MKEEEEIDMKEEVKEEESKNCQEIEKEEEEDAYESSDIDSEATVDYTGKELKKGDKVFFCIVSGYGQFNGKGTIVQVMDKSVWIQQKKTKARFMRRKQYILLVGDWYISA